MRKKQVDCQHFSTLIITHIAELIGLFIHPRAQFTFEFLQIAPAWQERKQMTNNRYEICLTAAMT